MQAIIRKRVYSTETAQVIYKHTVGTYGDPTGYEEILFQTPEGLYFEYCNGGCASPHDRETIHCVAKTKVRLWLEQHHAAS